MLSVFSLEIIVSAVTRERVTCSFGLEGMLKMLQSEQGCQKGIGAERLEGIPTTGGIQQQGESLLLQNSDAGSDDCN